MYRSKHIAFAVGLFAMLAACSAQTSPAISTANPQTPNTPTPTKTATPSPTPFPMQDGLFTGNAHGFLLTGALIPGYSLQDEGFESANDRVIELRDDGEAYIAATGRQSGWQIQFNRQEGGEGPSYIVHVVNTFSQLDGPVLAISPDWQQTIYAQFENGGLEQLSSVEGLEGQTYLMWRNNDGSVGLQIVYRNLLLFYTGPYESDADPLFFAQLALNHIAWIQSHE
jgi:hypothetical protein